MAMKTHPGIRLGLLALMGLLLPACGQSLVVAPTLFTDGFNSGFPGTAWTAPVITGIATVAVDSGSGFPAPCLKMTTTGITSTVKTDSTTAFSNPSLTLSAHMANLSSATTQLGTGTISILDATPAVAAFASWDNATGLITFHINGGAADASVALAADGNFHRIVFNVSSAGTASWSLDNAAAAVSQTLFPAGLLKVELGAGFGTGTAWPSFYFDNINATSP
jgi:hypothetical protein